jgi:hypothetical protein
MYIKQSMDRMGVMNPKNPFVIAQQEDEEKRRLGIESFNKRNKIKTTPQPSAAGRQQIQEDYLKKGITKQRQDSSYIDQRMDEIFGEGLRNAQAAERRKGARIDLENSRRDPIKEDKEKKEAKRKQLEKEQKAEFDRNLKNMATIADINKTNRS